MGGEPRWDHRADLADRGRRLLGALDADGGPAVVLEAAEGQKYGLDLRADRAVLSGFVLRGFAGAVGMWGPEGHTQRGVTIENVRIELDGDTRDGIVSFGDNRAVPGRPPTLDGLLLLDVSVAGADLGVSCNAGGGLYLPADARLSLRHDLFGDRDALLLDMGGRSWSTRELADLEAVGLGQGNLVGAPLLCKSWMPAADSPLIDAGEPVPGLDRDLWGSPRSSGTAPDIGPVERPSRSTGVTQPGCAGGAPQNSSSYASRMR